MQPKTRKLLTIKEWDSADQPREKLLEKGVNSLSNSELLAIIVGSGVAGASAVALMQSLLKQTNNKLNPLYQQSIKELTQWHGIGQVKAIKIKAALALGVRYASEATNKKQQINNSQKAFECLQSELAHLDHEQFWILYLNQAHRLLEKRQLSKGGIAQTIVDIRLILKKAFELGAVAFIIAHNHPSGRLDPSISDLKLTRRIQKAASFMDIKLLDHLIVSEKKYFSFADNQKL